LHTLLSFLSKTLTWGGGGDEKKPRNFTLLGYNTMNNTVKTKEGKHWWMTQETEVTDISDVNLSV
jgi:hypothetical protein